MGRARSSTTTASTPFAASHDDSSAADGTTALLDQSPGTPWPRLGLATRFAAGVTPTYPPGIRKANPAVACQVISSPFAAGISSTFSSGRSTEA